MAEQLKSPQEELKEKAWQGASRLVITAVLIGAGYLIAYLQYGDAATLRKQVKQQQDRVVDLENERETISTRLAKEGRDKEQCVKELAATKKAAGAPAPAVEVQ